MPFSLSKLSRAASWLFLILTMWLMCGSHAAAQEHRYQVRPWSFGVMGDTQWTLGTRTAPVDPAGNNPNAVSVSILNQLNQQFIRHGVRFVIALGDLTNWGGEAAAVTRADAAADLYRQGIGFFPMRGNHETYGSNPAGFIPFLQKNFPQTRGQGNHLFGAANFSSPTSVSVDLDGISYSFDYGNARFVILDTMATMTRTNDDFFKTLYIHYGYTIGQQQDWINSRLKKRSRGLDHAFVLSHQPLMGANHFDSPFGGYTNESPEQQNAFFASLPDSGVRYYMGAHDHLYQRSILASPDGKSKVEQLIAAPASSKFYTPQAPDVAGWKGQKSRETALSQELNNVGYYIYTVDGPRVTVDYYSDARGNYKSDSNWPTGPVFEPPFEKNVTPVFNFVKKETWGYGLNGKEFLISQGEPYTVVADTFRGSAARILGGMNNSAAMEASRRPLVKKVTTAWIERPGRDKALKSDILSLWGMAELGADRTDPYVLSMTFKHKKNLGDGSVGIATVGSDGKWIRAVDANRGGEKKFVAGPYKAEYGLGTYGVDPRTKTAWAVINYTGDFAVAAGMESAPDTKQ